MFRKISQNSLGNTCSEVPFSIKLQTWSPKACHFTTQRTPLQVFSREFWEIFRLSCFWRKPTNGWFWRVHIRHWLYQKQPPEMFYKKSSSWKFHNIHKKTPASESLFDKIAGFVKRDSNINVSSEYCEHLFWTTSANSCFSTWEKTAGPMNYGGSQLSFIFKKTLSAV